MKVMSTMTMRRSAAFVSNASHQPLMTALTLNSSARANVTCADIECTCHSVVKVFCVAVTSSVAVIVDKLSFIELFVYMFK